MMICFTCIVIYFGLGLVRVYTLFTWRLVQLHDLHIHFALL